jgi:hypothetical protein
MSNVSVTDGTGVDGCRTGNGKDVLCRGLEYWDGYKVVCAIQFTARRVVLKGLAINVLIIIYSICESLHCDC